MCEERARGLLQGQVLVFRETRQIRAGLAGQLYRQASGMLQRRRRRRGWQGQFNRTSQSVRQATTLRALTQPGKFGWGDVQNKHRPWIFSRHSDAFQNRLCEQAAAIHPETDHTGPNTESQMPSIEIQVLEGVFSVEEKAEIIQNVTAAFGEVAGETIKNGTSVRVLEVASGSWGYAGNVLTTEDGLAMKARG